MSGREYPEHPRVGVGGVIIEQGKVLLVRRGSEPMQGEWSLPGGLLELGEELAQALRREIEEETGLRVAVGPMVEVLDRIHRDALGKVRFHYVLVDFLCRVESGTLEAASDAAAAQWVAPGDLGQFHLQAETLRVIEKALELAVSNQ
ncbi:MAG: NUDIX domain-containing protein [Acidobacteria bacterium]|nr:NUDIX domain-containing protein [Acidobacteriota bacterium]